MEKGEVRRFFELHSHRLLHYVKKQKEQNVRRLTEIRDALGQVLTVIDFTNCELESMMTLLNNMSCYEGVSPLVMRMDTLVQFRKYILESLVEQQQNSTRSLYTIFYFISNLLYENSNS